MPAALTGKKVLDQSGPQTEAKGGRGACRTPNPRPSSAAFSPCPSKADQNYTAALSSQQPKVRKARGNVHHSMFSLL